MVYKFSSKLEQRIYGEIQEILPSNLKVTYETLTVPYEIPRKYTPDFVIENQHGKQMFIEAKGYFRWEDMEKMLAVRRSNPGMDIRFVFERNNPVRKGSKMRYVDWAKKHGFMYAIASVPKEWLDEH